jgi:hypothetical protein
MAVFIDFTKAFDLLNRSKLLRKLKEVAGPSHAVTKAIKKIVACNYVKIAARQNNSSRPMEYSRGTP